MGTETTWSSWSRFWGNLGHHLQRSPVWDRIDNGRWRATIYRCDNGGFELEAIDDERRPVYACGSARDVLAALPETLFEAGCHALAEMGVLR